MGDPVDDRMRYEIVGLLELLAHHLPRARGRPVDSALRARAAVVGVLHEKHGIPLKVALFGAAPRASEDDRIAIERTYRALRESRDPVPAPAALVQSALASLVKKNERRK